VAASLRERTIFLKILSVLRVANLVTNELAWPLLQCVAYRTQERACLCLLCVLYSEMHLYNSVGG
jgi:hypothetical protein